jgi:hypothetical protein
MHRLDGALERPEHLRALPEFQGGTFLFSATGGKKPISRGMPPSAVLGGRRWIDHLGTENLGDETFPAETRRSVLRSGWTSFTGNSTL